MVKQLKSAVEMGFAESGPQALCASENHSNLKAERTAPQVSGAVRGAGEEGSDKLA